MKKEEKKTRAIGHFALANGHYPIFLHVYKIRICCLWANFAKGVPILYPLRNDFNILDT